MTRRIPLLGRGRSNGTTTTRRESPSPSRRPVGVHYYKKSSIKKNTDLDSSTALLAEHERIAGLIHPSAPPSEEMSAGSIDRYFTAADFGGPIAARSGRRGGGGLETSSRDASSTGFTTASGSHWDGDLNEYMAPMSEVGGIVLTDPAFDTGSESLSADEVDNIVDAVVDDMNTRNGVMSSGKSKSPSNKSSSPQTISRSPHAKSGGKPPTLKESGKPPSPKAISKPPSPKASSKLPSPKASCKLPSPKPTSRPPSPQPTSRPTSPQPTSRPTSPQPTSRPTSPQPTSRPTSPQPISKPSSPQTFSRPASPKTIPKKELSKLGNSELGASAFSVTTLSTDSSSQGLSPIVTESNAKKNKGQPSPSSVRDLAPSPRPPTPPQPNNKKGTSNSASALMNRTTHTSSRPPRSNKSNSAPTIVSSSPGQVRQKKTAITVVSRTPPSPTSDSTASTSNDNQSNQSSMHDSFSSTQSAPLPLSPPQRANSAPTDKSNEKGQSLPQFLLRMVKSNDDTETGSAAKKASPANKHPAPPLSTREGPPVKETIVMTPTPVANKEKDSGKEPKTRAAQTSGRSVASSTSSIGSPTSWMDAVADNTPKSPAAAITPPKSMENGETDTRKKDSEVAVATLQGMRFSLAEDPPKQERPPTPTTSATSTTDQSVATSAAQSATTSAVVSRGGTSLDTSGGSTKIVTNVRPNANDSATTIQSSPDFSRRPTTHVSTPAKANSTGGLATTSEKETPTTANTRTVKDPPSAPGAPEKPSRSKSRGRSGGGGVTLNPKSNKPRRFYSKSPSRKSKGAPAITKEAKKPKLVRDFDLKESVGFLSLVLPVPKTIPDNIDESGAETVSTIVSDNPGTLGVCGKNLISSSNLEAAVSRVPRSPCSAGSDKIALSEVVTDLAVRNTQTGSGEIVARRKLLVSGTAKDRLEETIRCAKAVSAQEALAARMNEPPSPFSFPGKGKSPVNMDDFVDRGKDGPVDVDVVSVSTFLSDPEKSRADKAKAVSGAVEVDKVGIFGWKRKSQQQQKKQQQAGKKEKLVKDESGTSPGEFTRSPSETARTANHYIKENRFSEAAELYRSFLRSHRKEYGSNNHLVASTLHNLAIVMVWSGDYGKALAYCKEALKIRRGLNGVGHLDVSASLSELGIIYFARDEFNLALLAFREALQISCKTLGYEDPQIARILNNIGCVHFETGKLIAGLATFEESLDIQRSSMGSSSDADNTLLNVSSVLCNMAIVSVKRRQIDTAVSLMEEGLMVQESVLGDDHPKVVHTTENLAQLEKLRQSPLANKKTDQLHVVGMLGRGGAAGGVAKTSVKSSPPKKIDNGSASARSQEGKSQHQRFRMGSRKKFSFGPTGSVSMFGNSDGIPKRRQSSGYMVDAMYIDGIDIVDLGPIKKPNAIAQRVRESVLETFNRVDSGKSKTRHRRKAHDDSDDLTVYSTGSVFSTSSMAFDSDDRNHLSMPVDVDEENVMDAELHLKPIYDQAEQHLAEQEYDEAIELFEGVLRNHKEKYGEIHHLVGSALHNLGIVQLHAAEYSKALSSFQEAVNVRTAALGPDHPDVAASNVKCGLVLLAKEDLDGALFTFGQLLRSRRKSLGYNHPQIAKLLNNIGCVHHEFGGTLAAMKSFEEALEMQRSERTKLVESLEVDGERAPSVPRSGALALHDLDTTITMSNMAFIRFRRGEFGEAMVIYEEALQIQRDWLGYTHKNVKRTLESLAYAMASARAQKNQQMVGTMDKLTEMYVDMLQCRVGNNNCSPMVDS